MTGIKSIQSSQKFSKVAETDLKRRNLCAWGIKVTVQRTNTFMRLNNNHLQLPAVTFWKFLSLFSIHISNLT